MVSGSNGQHSRPHGIEHQDLCQINEVAERRHQGKNERGQEREKEEIEHGRGSQGAGRTPEVHSTVQE